MPYNVSHSEVDAYTRCQWAHLYSYGYDYSPENSGDPLQMGNILHPMLSAYYKALRDGADYDTACDAGREIYYELMAKKQYSLANMVVIDPLYDRYVEYYHPREWEVLAAEEYFEFPIDDKEEIILNFAIDLAIRQRGKGKYAGDVGIVDHKAVGNFLTNNELAMHTQLPKYIYAANQLGLFGGNIKFGILNQVRYKAPQKFDASKTFARVILEPSVARQENMIKEHLKTARHIVRKRKMPVTEVREEATKTLIKDICKWCDYRSPCDQELEGNDPSQTLAVFFKPRDYSYREGRVKRI